jgi:hypothetical protein
MVFKVGTPQELINKGGLTEMVAGLKITLQATPIEIKAGIHGGME